MPKRYLLLFWAISPSLLILFVLEACKIIKNTLSRNHNLAKIVRVYVCFYEDFLFKKKYV